ncbi:MAG: 30S ribosomal protein S2 [Myxococcota bacterium]|nr:30S ribosomal protein S2 [Myxococcota bacterium]
MSETTATPSGTPDGAADAAAQAVAPAPEPTEVPELSIRSLLEAGVHFGHQTRRWNPKMRSYIFGDRNGTHILDLDQTLPRFVEALEFLRETAAQGGKVLFVGTKRQAAPLVEFESVRSNQYYVSNRWLGGTLTNWKTVRKSIDRYKQMLEMRDDEEKRERLSKKELARVNRLCDKYKKSLAGIKEMSKLPDAVFIIDVSKEEIGVSEARRLGIPIVAIVDSNCDPDGIDFVIPGNDDAIRSLDLYCKLVAQACIDGEADFQKNILAEKEASPAESDAEAALGQATGRRVVEIKQPPRRGRGQAGGRTHTSAGWADREAAKAESATDAPPAAAEPAAAAEAAGEQAPDLATSARPKPELRPGAETEED